MANHQHTLLNRQFCAVHESIRRTCIKTHLFQQVQALSGYQVGILNLHYGLPMNEITYSTGKGQVEARGAIL